jgi:hypothetical protein
MLTLVDNYEYIFLLFFYSEDIVAIGTDDDIAQAFEGMTVDKKIDASGCCILPGRIEFEIFYN